MQSTIEREAFSERLRALLERSGYPSTSPTWLAKEFNRRYDGSAVTLHAVRKWIQGDALPSQDKVRVLAVWLGVSPEWLRYGDVKVANLSACRDPSSDAGEAAVEIDLQLMHRIARLSLAHRQVVDDLVASLQRLESVVG